MSVFEMPIRLYIMTEIVITATYGNPSAKYKDGIQLQGEAPPDLPEGEELKLVLFFFMFFMVSAKRLRKICVN